MGRRYLVVATLVSFVLTGCSSPPQSSQTAPVSKIGCQKTDGTHVTSADVECANALPDAICGAAAQECKAPGVTCTCQKQFE